MGIKEQLPSTEKSGWPWTDETDPSVYASQKAWPKISIVTPSYNQGKYIEETIRSLLLQNYPNLEYIVIDGGSNDNTLEILRKYDRWIHHWVSEPDNGQSDAINKGLKVASGEIFNWINSDDYLAPNALFEIGSNFKENSLAICGFCSMFDAESLEESDNYQMLIHSTLEETLVFRHMNQPATFLNLAKVKEVGGINEHLNYVMDFELWVKLLLLEGQDKIVKVDAILSNFRLHSASESMNDQRQFRQEEYAIYISIAEQIITASNIIDHLKTLTQVSILNQRWSLSNYLLPGRFELELKRRFYPILISNYYRQHDYQNCKVLFKEQTRTFGWEIRFGFFIDYFKFSLLPVTVIAFLRRLNQQLSLCI